MQRFLLIWLVALSAVAYFWDAEGSRGFDPFGPWNKPLLQYLIAGTMFAIGSLLPRDEVAQVARRWPTVLGGTALQYTIMPLLAYCAGRAFQLEPDAMTGVIMVGCVPGAMASNVLTLAARGNVSYSVSLTTSATLLSPLAVPVALQLTLGTMRALNPLDVSRDLLLQVVGPVLTGHLLSRRSPGFARFMQAVGPVIANGVILWVIAVVVGLNRDRLQDVTPDVLMVLLTINLLGYAGGYAGGRFLLNLPGPMRRALTLEIGMQNAGLGTVLILSLFPDSPQAAIPTAGYTFGCMFTGTILAQWWARSGDSANVAN